MALTERKAPRPRGQGQWALGYHEPLNVAEQIKKEGEPLDVRERIERIFAPGGFRSIGKQDLRNRMRWWGLYTQRKQGVPGERTGSAEPEELEDEYFMMRIRIDGGLLTSDQLRAIAWASETCGRDLADVTDRQNVQLHWIRIEDVPAIWERLESTGLTTAEACGDTPRVILGCPLAGVAADEILDATPAIAEIQRPLHRDDGVLEPPAQVQDLDQWLRLALHRSRDQRHLTRRRRPPGARSGLRPLGRRWALDEPDVRATTRGLRPARAGTRDLVGGHEPLPRVRLPPLAQPVPSQVPGQGLGSGGVPPGAREGVPRRAASRRAGSSPSSAAGA